MKLLIKNTIFPLIKSRPDFLIIGVQRAGTTSVYKYLIQHPQISVTHPCRETYYFDIEENYQKGFGWYLGHFPFKFQKQNKLTFEASPSYLYYPQIPQRLKQDLGEIKMIVMLRNPAERAYSAWQMFHSYSSNVHQHLKERADTRSFSEAIAEELNPESNTAKYPYNYIDRGKYAHQLKNYYKYFHKENILVLQFEKIKTEFDQVLSQVCDFLEIDRFSHNQLRELKEQKYAAAKYKTSDEDLAVMDKLAEYFLPFNEQLSQLLNSDYNW